MIIDILAKHWSSKFKSSHKLLKDTNIFIKTEQAGTSSLCIKANQQAQSKRNIFTNVIIYKISITKKYKRNIITKILIVYLGKQCGSVKHVCIDHPSHLY